MPLSLSHKFYEGVRIFPVKKIFGEFVCTDVVFTGQVDRICFFNFFQKRSLISELDKDLILAKPFNLKLNQEIQFSDEIKMGTVDRSANGFERIRFFYDVSGKYNISRGSYLNRKFNPFNSEMYLINVEKCLRIYPELDKTKSL